MSSASIVGVVLKCYSGAVVLMVVKIVLSIPFQKKKISSFESERLLRLHV